MHVAKASISSLANGCLQSSAEHAILYHIYVQLRGRSAKLQVF